MQNILENRYRVVRVLGSGGFGETFLAEDMQMPSGRKCVVKQLKPVSNNPQFHELIQDRFQREAAILERLGGNSEQIPALFAYFQASGQFYLVQEWVQGQTLTEKIHNNGSLSEGNLREVLGRLLPVLSYIHSNGIIHRDIKPDNIILRKQDGKAVLIDFGAVRETMGTVVNAQGQPTSSIVIGTPGYMPSEQAMGRPVYGSDIYSLGVTAIYMLTGKQPDEIGTDPLTGEINWQKCVTNISPELVEIIRKATQYHARDRFSTAQEMLYALQSSAGSTQAPVTAISGYQQNHQQPAVAPKAVPKYSPGKTTQPNPQRYPQPQNVPPSRQNHLQNHQQTPLNVTGASSTSGSTSISAQGKNWTKIGVIAGGSLFGLFMLVGLVSAINNRTVNQSAQSGGNNNPQPLISNNDGNNNPQNNPQRRDREENVNDSGSPSDNVDSRDTVDSSQSRNNGDDMTTLSPSRNNNADSRINIPPKVNIAGNVEQTTKPNEFINGVWRLEFSAGATRHEALLYMKGAKGVMLTRYFGRQSRKTEKVRQAMRLWSSSQGLIIKGYNPVDFETKQPHPTYSPDEFFLQQRADGSIFADNCSANVCSPVRIKYIAKTLQEVTRNRRKNR
ncbi:MAG: serine/threonine-protein kinase [Cyanobacteria bacterium P01_A01_bin.45]